MRCTCNFLARSESQRREHVDKHLNVVSLNLIWSLFMSLQSYNCQRQVALKTDCRLEEIRVRTRLRKRVFRLSSPISGMDGSRTWLRRHSTWNHESNYFVFLIDWEAIKILRRWWGYINRLLKLSHFVAPPAFVRQLIFLTAAPNMTFNHLHVCYFEGVSVVG